MKNKSLPADYLKRAEARLAAIDTLFKLDSWADVVRESQEAVELALKSLIQAANIECPRVHDVGDVLLDNRASFPKDIQAQLPELAQISRSLRRDRELAFYGSEDLTPTDFYKKEDAQKALADATQVIQAVRRVLPKA